MYGMVFQPINMKNEQNITGSNTLIEDTPAPADSTPNTPGGTKPAKKMTRRVLIGGGTFHTAPELQLSKLSGASVEEEYTGRRY